MNVAWDECQAWATHWSQRWFLDRDGHDRMSLPDGIAGGWATHVEAYSVLMRTALAASAGAKPVDLSWPERLKARGLDRPVRAFGLRALGFDKPREPEATPDGAAVIVEIPTPSMLDPARMVYERLPDDVRSLAVADPRAARVFRRHAVRPWLLVLDAVAERRAVRDGWRAATAAFDRLEAGPPTLTLGTRDLTRPALVALRSALTRSLAWLVPESRALQRYIGSVRPRAIAVASDQHRIGRLTVHLAAARVLVLQHGLPQAPIGYLPVVAGRVAVWSEASREWFVARGTQASALVVTGNPRLDHLVGVDRDRHRRVVTQQLRITDVASGRSSVRLLLGLSPTDPEVNSSILRICLDILPALPEATLVVKLHPGYRTWGFVRDIVSASAHRERVRIVHREPLVPLLAWADVLLVQRSTVAAEALAAGTPVVAVRPSGGAPVHEDAGLDQLAFPTASDGRSAAEITAELSRDSARDSYFAKRRTEIEWLNGPSDGRSAERIASLLAAESAGIAAPVNGAHTEPVVQVRREDGTQERS